EPRHVEDTGAFQEERPLLREEQLEAREVDLARIDLRLREVRVDGERCGQAGGDGLEDVPAELGLASAALFPTRHEGPQVAASALPLAPEPAELSGGGEVGEPYVGTGARPS